MSIATEITRLQGAKADLKTAIEGKGVTVSSSAKLDAYPALVDAISGGGGSDLYVKIIEGTNEVTTIVDNTLTKIKGRGISNVTSLVSAEFNEVTSVGDRIFESSLANFESISFPKLKYIGGYTFSGATKFDTYNLPLLEEVGTESFKQTKIAYAIFPRLRTCGSGGFRENTSLLGADFSSSDIGSSGSNSIAQHAFNSDTSLSKIVIRRNAVMNLTNINAFAGTPFASDGSGGTLYVPNDLISSYQAHTNWSVILGYTNNQIKSIESTHTDPNAPIDLTTHYVDGTLIPS